MSSIDSTRYDAARDTINSFHALCHGSHGERIRNAVQSVVFIQDIRDVVSFYEEAPQETHEEVPQETHEEAPQVSQESTEVSEEAAQFLVPSAQYDQYAQYAQYAQLFVSLYSPPFLIPILPQFPGVSWQSVGYCDPNPHDKHAEDTEDAENNSDDNSDDGIGAGAGSQDSTEEIKEEQVSQMVYAYETNAINVAWDLVHTTKPLMIVWTYHKFPAPKWRSGFYGWEQEVFIRSTLALSIEDKWHVDYKRYVDGSADYWHYPLKCYSAVLCPDILVFKDDASADFEDYDSQNMMWVDILMIPLPRITKIRYDGSVSPQAAGRQAKILTCASKYAENLGYSCLIVPPYGPGYQNHTRDLDFATAKTTVEELQEHSQIPVYFCCQHPFVYQIYKNAIDKTMKTLGISETPETTEAPEKTKQNSVDCRLMDCGLRTTDYDLQL